jgi:hypothetical protein
MMTINNLCLFSITEFLDEMVRLKSKYGAGKLYLSVNMLRWPSFMSPLVLPDDIKSELHFKLGMWYTKHLHSQLLSQGELAQIKRLLDYIEVLEKGHVMVTDDRSLLFHDFKSFFTQYDKRREKNLIKTFPRLTEWYNGIELQKEFSIKYLNQHGITPPETGEYQ